jgi:hypothetical protein
VTIRSLKSYVDALWDWGFLDGCFGGSRIRVSDVDGIVEHNGYFLLIEAKSAGKDVPRGQAILFDHLVANEHWAVLVIWGAPGVPKMARFWGKKPFGADEAKIQEMVARWYKHADDAGKRYTPPEVAE